MPPKIPALQDLIHRVHRLESTVSRLLEQVRAIPSVGAIDEELTRLRENCQKEAQTLEDKRASISAAGAKTRKEATDAASKIAKDLSEAENSFARHKEENKKNKTEFETLQAFMIKSWANKESITPVIEKIHEVENRIDEKFNDLNARLMLMQNPTIPGRLHEELSLMNPVEEERAQDTVGNPTIPGRLHEELSLMNPVEEERAQDTVGNIRNSGSVMDNNVEEQIGDGLDKVGDIGKSVSVMVTKVQEQLEALTTRVMAFEDVVFSGDHRRVQSKRIDCEIKIAQHAARRARSTSCDGRVRGIL
jgi:DNA repair exonuclease SbcCD ATPase subunit